MRDFVTSSCNNNTDSDSGIVAFLYLYMRLFSALPPLAVNLSSEIPIGPVYSLLNKHMNFRPYQRTQPSLGLSNRVSNVELRV